MMRQYLLILWVLAFAFVFVSSVHSQNTPTVKKIELKHVGPQAVSEALIRANIRVREGEPYSRAAIDDDVRNLYGTGYFYNIRVGEETAPDGIILTYVLQGKLRLTDIKFEGNTKFSAAKLQKKMTSKVGEPLDERKLFADKQSIITQYQKSGYQQVRVDYSITPDENAGRGTVTFKITESPKVKIVEVRFEGAQSFSQRKLRKVIKTRRAWMFSWLTGSGKLKDEQFEDDKDKLSDFYRNNGYIDFELRDVKFDYSSPKKLTLRFLISEGRRYKVGAIGVKGVTLFPTNDILKTLKMKVGEIFTPKGLKEDTDAVQDYYGGRGYIDARVFARKNPNTETGTMDLEYELNEGDKSYIEKIEIKGNVKTKDKVIRRELSVAPGEVFDMVRVKRSKSRLEQMNFFERVEARPEETDVPNRKNLVVGVDEKNTGNFTIGAGFSSVDALVGFVELNQGNFDLFHPPTFTGAGQKFRLRASIGTQRQDYQISFVEPWFLDRKLAFGTDLYHRELRFLSSLFDERRTGGKLSLTRALGSDFLIGSIGYTLENVGIDDVDRDAPVTIRDTEGDYLVSKFGASLAYDTRNSTTLPDSGQRSELSGEFAGGPFGGDLDYYKFEARTSWYFPGFFEGHIWEIIGRAGVIDSYGDGVDTRSRLGRNKVPFFDRWFLGGAYSLRGFRFRDVGPQELGGDGLEPVGGNTYYLASVEYSLPIIERLRFALFYDMGNVYYKSYDFDFGEFSANWGVGIRLNLPIGPLRLDYGIPIRDAWNTGGSGRFNFTVGYTREF